jgi:methylated-DNA-[protein]-cysteine S-methyltransferase
MASPDPVPSLTTLPSPFGPIVLVLSLHHERKHDGTCGAPSEPAPYTSPSPILVHRIHLSFPDNDAVAIARSMYTDISAVKHPAVDDLLALIDKRITGTPLTFDHSMLDWSRTTPFQHRVLEEEARVPRGRVRTYGSLACKLGSPGAARAVGSALANNPFPLIIPCHRAIGSDRSLRGFQGGPAMKRALLVAEGVAFDDRGRVQARFVLDD